MKIHTSYIKTKDKRPKVVIHFESEKERAEFIEFCDALCFDDLPTLSAGIQGHDVYGVDSEAFMSFLACHDATDCTSITGTQGEPFAVWWDIAEINTDPKRFQNRTNAFSELSAEQVAKNYDENKLDPIIVWRDPKNNKIYVLSGHSRYEGMHRRGEPFIPIRFFVGTEGDAIKFARIDANRAANKENFVEDLNAYKLSRDGDMTKGITPMNKADLRQAFKGKEAKLEAWSYLNPLGKFVEGLGQEENISQFPRIQSYATWVGKLRKEEKKLTDLMESDMFNYFYHSARPRKLEFKSFRDLVLNRLALGKDRIFPECEETPCKVIHDLREVGPNKDIFKEISKMTEQLQLLKQRWESQNPVLRIYTEEERKALLSVQKQVNEGIKRLQRDLKILEKQPSLLGPADAVNCLLLELLQGFVCFSAVTE